MGWNVSLNPELQGREVLGYSNQNMFYGQNDLSQKLSLLILDWRIIQRACFHFEASYPIIPQLTRDRKGESAVVEECQLANRIPWFNCQQLAPVLSHAQSSFCQHHTLSRKKQHIDSIESMSDKSNCQLDAHFMHKRWFKWQDWKQEAASSLMKSTFSSWPLFSWYSCSCSPSLSGSYLCALNHKAVIKCKKKKKQAAKWVLKSSCWWKQIILATFLTRNL